MELGLDAYRRNDRLVQRCRVLGCDTYVSGQGAGGYMDPQRFAEEGLKLVCLTYPLGRRLLGDRLKYSVLVAIGRLGLGALRAAFAAEPKSDGMAPA
jgi:hypothetical protein